MRGQYAAGKVNGEPVPGYREEPGVAPDSGTETFAALRLRLENWRWAGVPFYVRSGKRLARRETHLSVQFRMPPLLLFEHAGVEGMGPNRLDILVQPDLFVVPIDEARAVHQENRWTLVHRLLLAVEVLSPSNSGYDRFTKRALYQRMGVPLHWVIDPDRREAEVWTPERHFPEVERDRLAWHPEGADEPLTLDLPSLFAPP